MGVIHEVIKVRFGKDVPLAIRYTDNGVLLPKNMLDKQTRTFTLHLMQEMWESDDIWSQGKMFAYSFSADPLTHHNLGPGNPLDNLVSMGGSMRVVATNSEHITDPEKFIKRYRETTNISANCVFMLEKTGDIFYFQGGGLVPVRKNNVVQGVYPKIGANPDNKWQGRVPHEELPYTINPASGFIVSANNHMTSTNVKHGLSQAFTLPGRKTRITELIEEALIRTENKLTVRDF